MLIDVHTHILPPDYVRAAGEDRIGALSSAGRAPRWSAELQLEAMDSNGVDVAVTSLSAPGFAVVEDRASVPDLARRCNVFAAELGATHPGRFGMFAALPLPDIDAALAEVTFALDELEADGVCLLSNYDGRYLGDPVFAPLMEELDRRGAVVFVHPTSLADPPSLPGVSQSLLEFAFDTTRTAASLLFGGVLARRRGIRFIFAHAGGALPYLAHRMEVLSHNSSALREAVPDGVEAELARQFFDTALSAGPLPFASLQALAPASQILFGTDFPFGPKNQMGDAVAGLAGLSLTNAGRAAIQGGNALRLMPRLRDRRAR